MPAGLNLPQRLRDLLFHKGHPGESGGHRARCSRKADWSPADHDTGSGGPPGNRHENKYKSKKESLTECALCVSGSSESAELVLKSL